MTVTEMRLEHSLICLLLSSFIQEIIFIKLDDILHAVQGIGRKEYKKMSYVNHSRAEMQSVGQNNTKCIQRGVWYSYEPGVYMDVGADLILKNIHLLAIEEGACDW